MLENKNPWYKKWWVYLLGVVMIAIIIAIPFIINYAYLKGTADGQPNTAFSANDLLSIYGSFLAFIGTVVLGIVAVWQNSIIHNINLNNEEKQNNIKFSSNIAFNNVSSQNYVESQYEEVHYDNFESHKCNTNIDFEIENLGDIPLRSMQITGKDCTLNYRKYVGGHKKCFIKIGIPQQQTNGFYDIVFTSAYGKQSHGTFILDEESKTIKDYNFSGVNKSYRTYLQTGGKINGLPKPTAKHK